MEWIKVLVEDGRKGHVGDLLQDLLVDLMSLALNANHARWHVIGRARVLKEFPAGLVVDRQVLVEIAHEMSDVVVRARTAFEPLGASDPVSQHFVIEALDGLERWLWTLQAQDIDRSSCHSAAPVGELRQLRPAGA